MVATNPDIVGSDDKALKARAELRVQGMMATRQPWDRTYLEVARLCQPQLGSFVSGYGSAAAQGAQPTLANGVKLPKDRLNDKLTDAHGVWAAGVMANGMTSGMSSDSRPWFDLTTDDADLKEYGPVKTWLEDVKRLIYAFFARTNYYQANKSGYLELGVFGTEAGVMVDHPVHGGATFGLTAGEYWIGMDDALSPNQLARRTDMTAEQIVTRFGRRGPGGTAHLPRKVVEAYDNARYHEQFEVYHLVEPNLDRLAGRRDRRNKAFRSLYFMPGACQGAEAPLLAVEGFDDQPFWAARWDVVGSSSPYGHSPGMNAYADLRQLQFASLRKQQSIDFVLKPALGGPPGIANANAILPGRITAYAGLDQRKLEPLWETPWQLVQVVAEDVGSLKQAVDRSFYVDLFMAITNMPGVQPRNIEEIAKRNEEKLSQLGPVVSRVNNEKLAVAIDRAFMILFRQGRIPPAPPELQGNELKVEFVSILAQAQKLIGLGAIERGVAFVGNISAAFPDAADKLDADQAIDEYFSVAGVPTRMVRTDDQVAKLREDRARQAAAQRAAEQAPAMASAAADGADAARLLSETDVGGGQTMLQRLTGA